MFQADVVSLYGLMESVLNPAANRRMWTARDRNHIKTTGPGLRSVVAL
jgi:hypothetical protein